MIEFYNCSGRPTDSSFFFFYPPNRTVCELLLEADADVDQADLGGRTPLLAAASMGHGHIVELLLFWGCYVDSIDAEGRTVLSIAAAQVNAHSIFKKDFEISLIFC